MALSDYKKATGDMDGLSELMVYYCEQCAFFIRTYYVWEQYADAAINIWYATLEQIAKLPRERFVQLYQRLDIASRKMGDIGWGVTDSINEFMNTYSPENDEDEELDEIKPGKYEDMW